MTYDLALWRQRRSSKLSPAVVYICLAENVPCEAVAQLPVNRVERAFRELLESGPNFEFDLNEQWVHLTVPADGGEQVLEVATRVAQQLGLVLHDPQQVPPTHAETVHAERLVREGRPDEESPGAAELLRCAEDRPGTVGLR